MPELQDRVFGLSASTKTLVDNQREIANKIDDIYDEIDKVDKRIFAVAYAEGKKVLKCFKKSTAWNSLPREEKINQFIEYLKELKIRTIPSKPLVLIIIYRYHIHTTLYNPS